jgi:uncharacterized protein YdhG (YjbR/CyaY superfamily)
VDASLAASTSGLIRVRKAQGDSPESKSKSWTLQREAEQMSTPGGVVRPRGIVLPRLSPAAAGAAQLLGPRRNRSSVAARCQNDGHTDLGDVQRAPRETGSVAKNEIDDYLASLDEPKRSTLKALRHTILEVLPEAEEGMSYGVPAFRLHGKVIAGFAAFKTHLSYLPHSGSVFRELGDEIAKFKTSTGALQFPIDKPLPKSLVRRLITIRKRQALTGKRVT